jgi:hypothetical protein
MTPDQLIELKNNPALRGRLAKFFARECFRNSKLEELHIGKSPISETGDYSDVKVVTPSGEIPWNECGPIAGAFAHPTGTRSQATAAELDASFKQSASFAASCQGRLGLSMVACCACLSVLTRPHRAPPAL